MSLCLVPAVVCRLCIQMLFKEHSLEGAQALKSSGKQFQTRLPVQLRFWYHPLKVYTEVLFASQATSD